MRSGVHIVVLLKFEVSWDVVPCQMMNTADSKDHTAHIFRFVDYLAQHPGKLGSSLIPSFCDCSLYFVLPSPLCIFFLK